MDAIRKFQAYFKTTDWQMILDTVDRDFSDRFYHNILYICVYWT